MPFRGSFSSSTGGANVTQNLILDDFGVIPATAVNAVKTSFATSTDPETYTGGDFDGAVGDGPLAAPRTITITLAAAAGAYAVAAIVITGTDVNDGPQTANLTPSGANGGETLETLKTFKSITSIAFPAQADTDGAFQIGIGHTVGLRHTPVTAEPFDIQPFVGVFFDGTANPAYVYGATAPAGSPPNGSITFNDTPSPDGSTGFAAAYWENLA